MLKNKKENLYSKEYKEEIEGLSLPKYCEWKDCENKGEYKAPTSRDKLRVFKWFCLKHVKAYNKSWDYFKGKTSDDIYDEISKDARWHRPTWKRIKNLEVNDYHSFFKQNYEKNKRIKNDMPLDGDIKKALNIFNIEMPDNLSTLKSQYKKLVKKFHPDINKVKDKEFIIKLNNAYSTLKKMFKC